MSIFSCCSSSSIATSTVTPPRHPQTNPLSAAARPPTPRLPEERPDNSPLVTYTATPLNATARPPTRRPPEERPDNSPLVTYTATPLNATARPPARRPPEERPDNSPNVSLLTFPSDDSREHSIFRLKNSSLDDDCREHSVFSLENPLASGREYLSTQPSTSGKRILF